MGYGRRDFMETFFGRLKRPLRTGLRSRREKTCRIEIDLKLLVLSNSIRFSR